MVEKLAKKLIKKNLPFSDEEVRENIFYKDFLTFIKYVEENSPKLTRLKNIQLKFLKEINESLIKKKPWEERVGEYILKIRSEYEMPYIQALDALAEVLGLTRRFKGRLRIVKKAKGIFAPLPPRIQFGIIWKGYIHYLNWAYLQFNENGAQIAEFLQKIQAFIWILLKDYDFEANQGFISLFNTLETIREDFKITWMTADGDVPELARLGVAGVLFDRLLLFLDLVKLDKFSEKFQLTELGRKIIRFQVVEDKLRIIENSNN